MDILHSPWLVPLYVLLAYFIGSLSFAVIVSRVMGLSDPRSYGSGNPGATNVLRSGNKKAAVLTLLLDALKGYLPVMAAVLLRDRLGLGDLALGLMGLAAFIGHVWPVFFRFQGGKGVATAAGVLLALNPWLGAAVLLTWLLVAWLSRYSSLAALAAAALAPFYQLLLWEPSAMALPMIVMSLVLIWRHEPNIRKLLAGTESKIGQKAAPAAAPHPEHPHKPHGAHAGAHSHGKNSSHNAQRKGKH
jgi:glycerol-3-phosphate acyltransferase PlsY